MYGMWCMCGVVCVVQTPGEGEGLTVCAVEVLAECRGSLLPDPRYDAVK